MNEHAQCRIANQSFGLYGRSRALRAAVCDGCAPPARKRQIFRSICCFLPRRFWVFCGMSASFSLLSGRISARVEFRPFCWRFLFGARISAVGRRSFGVEKLGQHENPKARLLTFAAYGLSIFAAFLHFQSAIFYGVAPSSSALQILTFGSLALLVGLLIFNFKQTLENKAVWITALLIFAVSALHLSGEARRKFVARRTRRASIFTAARAGDSASGLSFRLCRFIFETRFVADFAGFAGVRIVCFCRRAAACIGTKRTTATTRRRSSIILTLWMATALVYPSLHKFAVWLVDKIILRRVDYDDLQIEIASDRKTGNRRKRF